MKRYELRCTEGTHNKFYNVAVADGVVTAEWGSNKLGSKVSTAEKYRGDHVRAERVGAALVLAKLIPHGADRNRYRLREV
jgi:hypothetical protein